MGSDGKSKSEFLPLLRYQVMTSLCNVHTTLGGEANFIVFYRDYEGRSLSNIYNVGK